MRMSLTFGTLPVHAVSNVAPLRVVIPDCAMGNRLLGMIGPLAAPSGDVPVGAPAFGTTMNARKTPLGWLNSCAVKTVFSANPFALMPSPISVAKPECGAPGIIWPLFGLNSWFGGGRIDLSVLKKGVMSFAVPIGAVKR